MNAETLHTFLTEMHTAELALNAAKRHDYANDTDVLQNFKITHIICKALGVEPAKSVIHTVLFFVVHKVVRVANLTTGGSPRTPKNEPLIDSVRDLRLYTALMGAAIIEIGEYTWQTKTS